MHHVCCRAVPHIPEEQLDLLEDGGEEIVRVHEGGVSRDHGDGLQCVFENSEKYGRAICDGSSQ